jgi:hypothetical protein
LSGFPSSSNVTIVPFGPGHRLSPTAALCTASGRLIPRCSQSLQCSRFVAPPPSLLVGVGHDKDPSSTVRRTNGGSWDNVPFRFVPDGGKGREDSAERAASIIAEKHGGVFCHKQPWLESRNNPEALAPHPSLIVGSFPMAGLADRLARRPGTDEINSPLVGIVWRERLHVAPLWGARPTLCQNATGVAVNLHLPLAHHPGTFEAQVKAADAGEQRPKGQWLPFHPPNIRAVSNLEMPLTTVSKVCRVVLYSPSVTNRMPFFLRAEVTSLAFSSVTSRQKTAARHRAASAAASSKARPRLPRRR